MTNLDSILKRRDITLLTNVCLGKAMVFPVVMYRCESWAIKKDGIKELMLLNCGAGGLSRVPWTARRSNQSILKEINSEYSFKGLMLKLQYFGHQMQRADSLEKTLLLGKIEGRRRRRRQRMRWLDGSVTQWTWVWVNSGSWWWTGSPGVLQSLGSQRVRHDWAIEMNWTELNRWLQWITGQVQWITNFEKHYFRQLWMVFFSIKLLVSSPSLIPLGQVPF